MPVQLLHATRLELTWCGSDQSSACTWPQGWVSCDFSFG